MNYKANILLVEDDDFYAEFIYRLFFKCGIQNAIYSANDGLEALEILRGENNRPKIPSPYIILSDILMPRMNGLQLLAEIRKDENLKNDKVYLLTSSLDDANIREAYCLNVTGYYLKADIMRLVNALTAQQEKQSYK